MLARLRVSDGIPHPIRAEQDESIVLLARVDGRGDVRRMAEAAVDKVEVAQPAAQLEHSVEGG